MWQGNYKLHEDKPVIEPTERVDIVQAGFGSYTSGRSNSASGAVARDLVEAENPDARVCVFTRHPDELTARLERAASFHHVSSEKLFPAKNLEDALAKFGNEPDLVIYAAAHKDERAALEGDFPVSDKRVAAFLYNRAILDKLNETMLASDSSARVIVLTNSPLYGMGTVPEIARELDKSVARDQFISPATELFRAKSTISGLLAKIINYAKKITVPRNGHSPRSGERQYDILKLSPSKINIEAIFGMHGSDFVIAPELVQVVDPHTGLCVPASAFFERRLKPEILKDFDVQEGGLTACISDCLSPDEISMLECRAEKRASSISNMSYTQAYFWEVAEHLVRVRGGIEVGNTGSSANILPHATKKLVDYLSGVRNGDVCAAFLLSESLPGGSVVNDTDSPLDLDQEHIPQYAIGTFQDGRLVRIHQPLDRLNPYDRNRVLALRGNLKADLDVAKGLYPASKHPDEIAISKMKTQYGFDPKILQKTG